MSNIKDNTMNNTINDKGLRNENKSQYNLQLAIVEKKNVEKLYPNSLTLYSAGSIVGASVSAIVYSSIVTSGDITGSLVTSGLNLGGRILGYGTELIAGAAVGNSIRGIATVSGAVAGPAISSSSRTVAAGVSLVAGALSAIATSAFIYGANEVGAYLYSKVEDCKTKVAEQIQHPTEVTDDISNSVLDTAEEYEGTIEI